MTAPTPPTTTTATGVVVRSSLSKASSTTIGPAATAAGGFQKEVICFIYEADRQVHNIAVKDKCEGWECLKQICKYKGCLEEAEYLGLQYYGPKRELLWLNLRNRIDRQLPGAAPYTLYLRVKFYVAPHRLLLEETRQQFYHNVKQTLCQGDWDASIDERVHGSLIAIMAQVQFGNFNEVTSPCKYACFWPDSWDEISKEVVHAAAESHREMNQQYPLSLAAQQQQQSMEKVNNIRQHELVQLAAEKLTFYGYFFYTVKDYWGATVKLAVGPEGVILCDKDKQILKRIPFQVIHKVTVADCVVFLHFLDDDGSMKVFGYRLSTHRSANAMYRYITEAHCFYRLETVSTDVVQQTSRDLKETLVSLLTLDRSQLTHNYVFDIKRTAKEVYDSARRKLHTYNSIASPETFHFELLGRKGSITESIQSDPLHNSTDQSKELTTLRSLVDSIRIATTCCICQSESIQRVFYPCAHPACCAECASQVQQCPLCRQDIINTLKLYMPFPSLPDSASSISTSNSSNDILLSTCIVP